MENGVFDERSERRPAVAARPRAGAKIRRPSKLRVAATMSADVTALLVAALIAIFVTSSLDGVPLLHRLNGAFDSGTSAGLIILILLTPYFVAALWVYGLYREPARSVGGSNLSEGMAGLTALTAASWLLLIFFVLGLGTAAPIAPLIAYWAVASLAIPLARWVGRLTVWSRPSFHERVLIIGAGEVGHTLAAKIAGHPEYRIDLVGFLDDGEPRRNGGTGPALPVIGALKDLDGIVVEERIDRVIIAFSRARHNDFLRVVRACSDSGVRINIVPRLFEVVSSQALVDDIEGIPLLDVANAELSTFNMAVKRVFDLIVGGLICVVALPLIAVVAVIIKLDSPGPVFFRQERMGRGGKTFRIFKFRTMHAGADAKRLELAETMNDYDGPMFKLKEDPRLTRIGGTLRRWSIDEVPQILNVMAGDMSLVGPRPLWVEEAKQCRGWTQKRLDITPGITGLWQVLGRSEIPFDEMVKLDYMYVTGWSLSWDIKLLIQTIPAVLNRRGAY
jgi:exopolysaccharide biosynthesis polyprenyl glycosylphosphotransferase